MNWNKVCADSFLRDFPFKIELNKFKQIVMVPAKSFHAVFQGEII
jgi:hypothetical protein